MAEELLDLPMDLCMEILARLHAKSLMRFRCVCKSWCSLIDSSDFRLLHLQIYNRKHKYVLGKKYGECSIHSIDTFEKIDVFYETRRHCPVMGSCNGLILMFSLNKDNVDELVLYNPCIRKSVVIPRFPYTCIVRSSSSRYREDGRVVYWQGFAPSCNDYKVFVIQSFDFGIRVYSLNANRWRIKNRLNVSIPGILSLIRNGGRVLEFKGAIYWLGYDNPDNNPGARKSLYDLNTHLVSLDFDSEKFKFVELPDAYKQTGVLQNCCFVLNESIAVFGMSSDRTCIWVLVDEGGGGKSWRLWYTGDSNLEALRFFRVGLCLQIFNVEKDTFYVFDFDRRLYSYNFKSHLIQHVENYVDEHNNLENYMESLILHNCTSKTKGRF